MKRADPDKHVCKWRVTHSRILLTGTRYVRRRCSVCGAVALDQYLPK